MSEIDRLAKAGLEAHYGVPWDREKYPRLCDEMTVITRAVLKELQAMRPQMAVMIKHILEDKPDG